MRKLIVVVLVLATLYGGYWYVGRAQIETRLTQALVEADAGDLNIGYDTLRTRGFPSRFDTTITDLVFEDPISRVTWQAPLFQVLALAYRPNEVIALFPNEQTLTADGEVFTLFTNDMRASGKVRPNAALAFQTATVEMENPRIRTEEGAELAMSSVLAAMRLTPETTQTYDVFFEARSIVLPEAIRAAIDPQNLQPPVIQSLRFDSDVNLSAPIELLGDDPSTMQIESLSITEFSATWGEISVTAIGDVTPDAAGLLDGSVTVVARNWQQALDLAVASGGVPDDNRMLVTAIASGMDETPDFPDTLTVTLSISKGTMAVGGFPLGQIPPLR